LAVLIAKLITGGSDVFPRDPVPFFTFLTTFLLESPYILLVAEVGYWELWKFTDVMPIGPVSG